MYLDGSPVDPYQIFLKGFKEGKPEKGESGAALDIKSSDHHSPPQWLLSHITIVQQLVFTALLSFHSLDLVLLNSLPTGYEKEKNRPGFLHCLKKYENVWHIIILIISRSQ